MKEPRYILALDPGTTQTGAVLYDAVKHALLNKDILNNGDISIDATEWIDELDGEPGALGIAIEMIASYGMAVGVSTFETCVWIGRFYEWLANVGFANEIRRVYRKDVKLHLCGSPQAKDANIRQALLDAFPPTGGGSCPQRGTKALPGPLYAVSKHMWAALAVAVTASEKWDELESFPK